MTRLYKKILFLTLTLGVYTSVSAECASPAIPIVPAGIVASKDEMLSASKAIQKMQRDLNTYRNCLTKQSLAISDTDDQAKAKKQALLDLYNQSVELEQIAADKFNASLKAYNSK